MATLALAAITLSLGAWYVVSAANANICASRCPGEPRRVPSRALGLLNLDGYYWPTQPGDTQDLRTWCDVCGVDEPCYYCKKLVGDDFGLKIATPQNLTWDDVQKGVWHNESMYKAVEYLMADPTVGAITGAAGWFSWYTQNLSLVMDKLIVANQSLTRKPFLLGSPAILAAFFPSIEGNGRYFPIPDWAQFEYDTDRVLLLVSNSADLKGSQLMELLRDVGVDTSNETEEAIAAAINSALGMECEPGCGFECALLIASLYHSQEKDVTLVARLQAVVKRFIVVGWENTLGYGFSVVSPGAMFHNAKLVQESQAGIMLLQKLLAYTEAGYNVTQIVMESTEMPTLANWVRNITGLPVWDSATVGKCVMAAAKSFDITVAAQYGNGPALFNNTDFGNCLKRWRQPAMYEKKFGLQPDGRMKYYETQNLTASDISQLTCTGGRPSSTTQNGTVIATRVIGRKIEDFDAGAFGPIRVPAQCAYNTPCQGFSGGAVRCQGTCPAGAYCGESTSPYGIRGELYYANQWQDFPEADIVVGPAIGIMTPRSTAGDARRLKLRSEHKHHPDSEDQVYDQIV